jgi:hypothetical protein
MTRALPVGDTANVEPLRDGHQKLALVGVFGHRLGTTLCALRGRTQANLRISRDYPPA